MFTNFLDFIEEGTCAEESSDLYQFFGLRNGGHMYRGVF